MHAIKGAWAGRTYALASSNESGGRKARIRRSKEERKELVVSFIKSHQKLNNGSFPSLNLTHKEVGGSFYTVREIVREVIQENRVLAPPKLLPGEQYMESFLEQSPLGSISVNPQVSVVTPNESQVPMNHLQYTSKEKVLDSRPIIELDQGTVDDGTIVNGSAYVYAESKESKGPIDVDFLLEQGEEADKAGAKELDAYLVTASNIVESLDESELRVSYQKSTNEEQVLDATEVSKSEQRSDVNGALVNGSSNGGEAASSPEEGNVENFIEQGPIRISSIDRQIDVESINESEIGVSNHKATNEEQALDDAHILKSDQGSLVNETIVTGISKAVAESKESKELINGKSLLERDIDGDKAGVDAYLVPANIVGDVGEEPSSPEEHNLENFMEQGPTGSSSIDHKIGVESLDESEIGVSNHKTTNEEQVLDDTHVLESDQGSLANGTIVNWSSKAVAESEESKEVIGGKSLLERGIDGDKAELKEPEAYMATSQTAESPVVESFPLRPVPQINYDSDEELIKSVVSVGALKAKDTEGLQVEAVNSSAPDRLPFLENSGETVKKKAELDLAGSLSETNGVLLVEKALLTKENSVLDVDGSTDLDVKDTLPTGNKPKVAANGIHAVNLQQATSDKAAATSNKQIDIADVGSSKTKGSDPTLDRRKLESWEAATEKSAGKETNNSLMAFIKAFVTAFVKFWSE